MLRHPDTGTSRADRGPSLLHALFLPSSLSLTMYSVQKSDDDWRLQLSPEQFRILRQVSARLLSATIERAYMSHIAQEEGH